MAAVDYSTMQIHIKTYNFKKDKDIDKILALNKVKKFDNAFEIVWKDVEKIFQKQTTDDLNLHMVMVYGHVAQLVLQNDSPFTLFRKNKILCRVCFVNTKHENKCFGSIVQNLDKNDRILIFNGVICKDNVKLSTTRITIGVRPENNSQVFLLKFGTLRSAISDNIPIVVKNISQITHQGVYSIIGCVSKIVKYPNDYMILRLLCKGRSCIKTRMYYYPGNDVSDSNSPKKKTFDCLSKEVDILVKSPCAAFTSLVLEQRVCLHNVKVKSSVDFGSFSFKIMGVNANLNADPIDTGSVNSHRSPIKHSPLPNELEPAVGRANVNGHKQSSIKELLTIGSQPKNPEKNPPVWIADSLTDDDDDDVFALPAKKWKKSRSTMLKSDSSIDDDIRLPSTKELPILHSTMVHSDSSIDDDVRSQVSKNMKKCQNRAETTNRSFGNSPPNKNLQNKPKSVNEFNANINTEPSTSRPNKNNSYVQSNRNSTPKKINGTFKINSPDQKCNNRNPISMRIFMEKDSSPENSLDDSCSPSFFQNPPEVAKTVTSDHPVIPRQLNLNSTNSSVCLGPCRLVITDPNVYCTDEIVPGYCVKSCFSLFPMSDLRKNSRTNKYTCPKCNGVVLITFFFKMTFLYGISESQAVEVYCYGDNAQNALKKLTKKNINVEDYLSNSDDRKLIIETLQMCVNKKIKMNIVICDSLIDKTKILLSLDTRYVVTSFY